MKIISNKECFFSNTIFGILSSNNQIFIIVPIIFMKNGWECSGFDIYIVSDKLELEPFWFAFSFGNKTVKKYNEYLFEHPFSSHKLEAKSSTLILFVVV